MANVSEIQQAKKWIYDSLFANADIAAAVSTRIFASVADSTSAAVFPYCLYTHLAGPTVDGLGTVRLLAMPLFQIIVVSDRSPDTTVRKVEKRIDDIFQNAVHQLSGDYYFTSRQEQSVDRIFTDATGRSFYSLGGLYRLRIGKTP